MTDVLFDECLRRFDGGPDARRLFHGRGHAFPGHEHVVVTWLPPYLLVGCYGAAPGFDLDALRRELSQQGPEIEGVAVQHRDGRRTVTEIVWGDVPDEHVVREAGLEFIVQPMRNQNIGLFMDMSHVRRRIGDFVEGANMLNLFAYTCAFSVAAIRDGAHQVVNNDMSRNALRWGERNHELNGQDLRRVRMLPHNLFKSWWKIRQFGPYDVLVIDPPTNQRGSFVAEKQYGQVLKRVPELAAPGATIVACLNSPFLDADFLTRQVERWAPGCRFLEMLPPHPDFPEQFGDRGLKVHLYRYGG